MSHGDADGRQAVDPAGQVVAPLRSANPFGRAGMDQIAGLQFPGFEQVFDVFGHAPDEFGHVAALAVDAVHLQPDGRVVDVTGLRNGAMGPMGAEWSLALPMLQGGPALSCQFVGRGGS